MWHCVPEHAPGTIDDRCPVTTWNGVPVQGCCKRDGECGNYDANYGCHDMAQSDWPQTARFYCDNRATTNTPAYYECSSDACQTDRDCCTAKYGDQTCFQGHCEDDGGGGQ